MAPKALRFDATQVQLALFNLLVNAAQATEGRGQVRVTVEDGEQWCDIVVADDGPGFDQGAAERLFEPFYTTKHRGTGLGLATARRVVEMHDGTLTASLGPHGGAVMRMRLPII